MSRRIERAYQSRVCSEVTGDTNLLSEERLEQRPKLHRVHAKRDNEGKNSLGDCEQIVPVHTLVLANFVVGADAASVDHDAALRVCLGVEEVVALGAEM